MPMPPWTRELLTGSVDEITARLRRNPQVRQLQTRATDMLGDLPVTAARRLDRLMQESRRGAEHVRRWARRQTSLASGAINGSGVLFHPSLRGVPLHLDQIDTLSPSPELFPMATGRAQWRIAARLQAALGQYVDAEVAVASSSAAAAAAIGAFAAAKGRTLAVPRSAAMRLEGGRPIPEALAAGGCRVIEIGTAERCLAEDWQHAAATADNPSPVTVDWPAESKRRVVGEAQSPQSGDMNALPIRFLPLGSFTKLPHLSDASISIVQRGTLDSRGITVLPGNRLVGGPQSALILASAETIASITSTTLWPALAADLSTLAALTVVLEQGRESDGETSPVAAMLETSEENLQNRCERLATQLVGSQRVATCQIGSAPASLVEGDGGVVPSRQLRITRPTGDASSWAQTLAAESPALLTTEEDQAIVVDLRWIPPSLDSELVRLLTDLPNSELESTP